MRDEFMKNRISYVVSTVGIVLLLMSGCGTVNVSSNGVVNKPETVTTQKKVETRSKTDTTFVSRPQPEPVNVYSYYYQEATAKYADPSRSKMYIYPNVADLEVSSTKITYSQTFSTKLEMTPSQFRRFSENFNAHIINGTEPDVVKRWKSQVVANASLKYQADEIVSPIFVITPNADKTEVEVKVTGYIGKYKNFRKATEKDINFLNTYNSVAQ